MGTDIYFTVLSLAIIAGTVYLIRLLFLERGEFEARGQVGVHSFFVRAKERRRRPSKRKR